MVFVNNKIKQEIKNIEIPSELHKRSKMGILKAKSEMRGNRRKLSKLLPYFATAACLAILIPLGLSVHLNNGVTRPNPQTTDGNAPPKQIQGSHQNIKSSKTSDKIKSAKEVREEDQAKAKRLGYDNPQRMALDGVADDMIKGVNNTKPEYTDFKYLLKDLNGDKNKDVRNYDTDIASSYVYAKYFMKVEPNNKADEQKLLDQATKVVESNHAPKDVQDLKDLISQLNQKYNK
jgi:hypothetical protein